MRQHKRPGGQITRHGFEHSRMPQVRPGKTRARIALFLIVALMLLPVIAVKLAKLLP